MARTFNGTSDVLVAGIGGASVFGPGTLAYIIRKASDGTTAKIPVCVGGNTDSDSYYGYLDNGTSGNVGFWNGSADATNLSNFLFAADGWALVAFTKPTGSATVRAHRYVYGTGVALHSNMSALANSPAPSVSMSFGAQKVVAGPFGYFPGDIAVAGVWNVAVTDAQVEDLAFSLAAWFENQPRALQLFDQSATGQKVVDLAGGGANESALTGTSVSASSVPVFNYGSGVWTPTIVKPSGVTPVTGSDSGTGTDAQSSLSVTASGSETSTATEAGTVSATVSSSDSATGSDSGSASMSGSGSESGTGSDSGSVSATLSGSDSATGTDTGVVEDISGATLLEDSDSGVGSETGSIVDLTPPPVEPGGGAPFDEDDGDTSTVDLWRKSGSDSGRGFEVGVVVDLTPRPVRERLLPFLRPRERPTLVDSHDEGLGAETSSIAVWAGSDDAGHATESGTLVDLTSEAEDEAFVLRHLLGVDL